MPLYAILITMLIKFIACKSLLCKQLLLLIQ